MSAKALKSPDGIEFRPLRRFPGYSISEHGLVWSDLSGCCLRWWLAKGYAVLKLRRGGRTVCVSVHRLVAEAFIGPRPDGMDVCHNDNNRLNNHYANLRYDTRRGNLADRDRHGTHQRGERNPSAKLTNEEADSIRVARLNGEPLKSIAARYQVRESTVSRIANGKRRREVKGAQG